MKVRRCFALFAVLSVAACASAPPPEPAPVSSPPPEPTPAAPVSVEPPKVVEPTPEEKKKADEQRQFQEEKATAEADAKVELARWTPELHAEAKALASKNFPSAKAALQAALAGKHRKPGNEARDKDRHPLQTFEFFGLKPTQTVLEYGPGEGWVTELLEPTLLQKGKLLVTSPDPNGPPDQRSTFYAQRTKAFLEKSPELYGKVQTLIVDPKAPKLGLDASVDLVVLFRAAHGLVNNGLLQPTLREIHSALKPNGVLAVEQHRSQADADPIESSKKGYLPEKWLIGEIESAGFKLAGKSELNANPKDTKDHPEGVWALPPTYRLKDKDREKYQAIGESDRMTLKFVKLAKAAAKVQSTP